MHSQPHRRIGRGHRDSTTSEEGRYEHGDSFHSLARKSPAGPLLKFLTLLFVPLLRTSHKSVSVPHLGVFFILSLSVLLFFSVCLSVGSGLIVAADGETTFTGVWRSEGPRPSVRPFVPLFESVWLAADGTISSSSLSPDCTHSPPFVQPICFSSAGRNFCLRLAVWIWLAS